MLQAEVSLTIQDKGLSQDKYIYYILYIGSEIQASSHDCISFSDYSIWHRNWYMMEFGHTVENDNFFTASEKQFSFRDS